MNTKQRVVLALGYAAMGAGSLWGLFLAWRLTSVHRPGGWFLAEVAFGYGLQGYLFFVLGNRAVRWARGQAISRVARMKWGRMLLGAYLIFGQFRTWYRPDLNRYQASNEVQASGMKVGSAIISLLGGWLLVTGVVSVFKTREAAESSAALAEE